MKPENTLNVNHEGALPTIVSPALAQRLQRNLLTWFENNARDLPWRKTKDPYAIWVSEVMLQQTQVDQVIPYYERFLKTFPTINDLARASLDQVLKAWEGMGYYTRARHLLESAQYIAQTYQGSFPDTYAEVRALPGLGAYSTGAILSIAFNQPYPALDGNAIRVLTRAFHLEGDPKQADNKQLIARYATRLIPKEDPGRFNQAVMELGALICLPEQPECKRCCWAKDCRAYLELPDPSVLPRRAGKTANPHHHVTSCIIWKGDSVLIVRRPPEGLLAFMWEFPAGTQAAGETLEQACLRHVKEELGLDIEVIAPFMSLEHSYSHFNTTVHAFYCLYQAGEPNPKTYTEFRWVALSESSQYAFPKASKILLENLQKQSRPGTQMDLFNPACGFHIS